MWEEFVIQISKKPDICVAAFWNVNGNLKAIYNNLKSIVSSKM